MASKRKLKKDVNYITYELLSECFIMKHFHPDLNETKFNEVIQEIVKKRNELILMINYPVPEDGETLRQFYRKVRKGMKELVLMVEKINS